MMDPNKQFFRPSAIQVSQFHFYSLGIVAENKALQGSDGDFNHVIEVTPIEEFTMLDGEINAGTTDLKSQGKDVSGTTYSTNVKASNTIQATWLKLNVGNRITSPDVRRGAAVAIYQFGDSESFYWTTLKDDTELRRLETVVWGFSANKDNSAANDKTSNMYYFELSTHTGLVAFHTSKANGEFCQYDIQINTVKGQVTITDDLGNYFLLDSDAQQLHMENTAGSIIDITKQIATITTGDQINLTTKTMNFKADTGNYDITTLNVTGTTLKVEESTTTVQSDSITTTGNSLSITNSSTTMNVSGSFDVLSPNMQFTGMAQFQGLSFIVVSPIIQLG